MMTLMNKIDFQMEEYNRLTDLIRKDGFTVCFHHHTCPTHISVWVNGYSVAHAASFKIVNNEIVTLSEGHYKDEYKDYIRLMVQMLLPLTQPYETK